MSVYETVYCLSTNFHNKQILQETIKRVFISLFVCLNMFQFTIHISKLLNKLINNFYEFFIIYAFIDGTYVIQSAFSNFQMF